MNYKRGKQESKPRKITREKWAQSRKRKLRWGKKRQSNNNIKETKACIKIRHKRSRKKLNNAKKNKEKESEPSMYQITMKRTMR